MSDKEKVIFKDDVYYYKNGWKQKIGNMTKIYVKGTDYERGLQFGKLLSNEIKSVVKIYLSYIILVRYKGPFFIKWVYKWMPFLLKLLLLLFYRKKVEKNIEKYPRWMVKELEAVAEGAKINPFYLKFLNAMAIDEDVLGDKELQGLSRGSKKSCCTFAFTGADGNIYHGKNLDWVLIEGLIDLICFQQREDEQGNWFSIIEPPGLFGLEFGMNSHGISIGLTGRFYRGKSASRLAFTSAVDFNILRFGKNLEEIRKLYDTRTGFDQTNALLITSASDRAYQLFEVTPRGVAMTGAADGKLFNTNTYVHTVFRSNNRQWGTIYDNQFRDPRYIRLQELMEKNPQTAEDAFDILTDTLQPGFEHKTFLGQATLNRFITHVSALMVHGKKPGVWIARDRTYAAFNEYFFFDYSSKPREKVQKRAANHIIYTERFNNFKEFMHLRENRYYLSSRKIISEGKQLLSAEPDNPIFILFLAQSCLKYNKFDRALVVLKRYPVEWAADYWYCLGRCFQGIEKYERAGECFSKAMKLSPIDGFPEMVRMICLVQQVKVNSALGLTREVNRLKRDIKGMQSKFATPNIGMPDYPYINNIIEQFEEIML